jgi:hypothetical protein
MLRAERATMEFCFNLERKNVQKAVTSRVKAKVKRVELPCCGT